MTDKRLGIIPLTLADWPTYANQEPLRLFAELPLISNSETASVIKHYCAQRGYLAEIDYIEDGLDCYVWHSLFEIATQRLLRLPIANQVQTITTSRSSLERRIVDSMVATLIARGIMVTTEVICAAGKADIVAHHPPIIYEVKAHLTRTNLFQAVGQVLLYRASINPQARVAIAGYPTRDTDILQPIIESLGIHIIRWKAS
jgi:hypothetical protein